MTLQAGVSFFNRHRKKQNVTACSIHLTSVHEAVAPSAATSRRTRVAIVLFDYGMTRDMVLGTEAVLADGTIVSSMNEMIKNNAGYDIKQLFIGTEGCLGIVTRAVVTVEGTTPQSRNRTCSGG